MEREFRMAIDVAHTSGLRLQLYGQRYFHLGNGQRNQHDHRVDRLLYLFLRRPIGHPRELTLAQLKLTS